MSRPHAILPPSGASRWLACTPSARLEQQFPDRTSEAAEEGTVAHTLGEGLIKYKLDRSNDLEHINLLEEVQGHRLYKQEMYDYCDDYATYVLEQYAEALKATKDAQLYTETRLDLTAYIPEGFGTGDVFIIPDGVLHFIDLKYGKGVPVSAERNNQMMVYALGALKDFLMIYDIHTVRMTIYQPRLDNVSTWEISVEELQQWGDTVLIPKARQAFAGEGDFNPGAHCRFCKAKAICRANADYNMEMARYDFKDAALLSDEEVADILGRYEGLTSWANSVADHALEKAVKDGKKWPGYKLVEGRSNRTYANETDVAARLKEKGFAEDVIYKKKLVGITDMEKHLGKKLFSTYLSDLVIKPAGKPTLAPITDKRPEYSSAEAAALDFAEIEIIDN